MNQPGSYDPWDDINDALDQGACPHEAHDRCVTQAAGIVETEAGERRAQMQSGRTAYMRDYMRRRRAQQRLAR